MKISVITVCYNSHETIVEAIESVLNQTHNEIELIVIDGGSTDGTVELIEPYLSKLSFFCSEPDKGIYDAMNKGIKHATGDVIAILNSDDFYSDDFVLQKVSEYFNNKPTLDIVYGDVVFVNESNLHKVTRYYKSQSFKPWQLRFGFMPAHPATFIKTSIFKSIGYYDIGYKIGADFDFFIRAFMKNNFNHEPVPIKAVTMREGGVSTSGLSSYITTTKEMLLAFKNNQVYSNILLLLPRLPLKFFKQKLFLLFGRY